MQKKNLHHDKTRINLKDKVDRCLTVLWSQCISRCKTLQFASIITGPIEAIGKLKCNDVRTLFWFFTFLSVLEFQHNCEGAVNLKLGKISRIASLLFIYFGVTFSWVGNSNKNMTVFRYSHYNQSLTIMIARITLLTETPHRPAR